MPTKPALPKIDPQDLQDFRYIFAPETRPRCGFQKGRGVSWETTRYGLSDEHILSHFNGPHYYATSKLSYGGGYRPYSQTLTIDIDADHKGALLPRDVRHDRVLRAFYPHEPVVFETPSGGLHDVYILTTFTPRQDIKTWAKVRLLEQGLVVENGSVEILEDKTLKRLPLSVGCRMLDPFTLDPIAPTNLECFDALVETLRDANRPRLYIPPQKATQAPQKAGISKPSPHAHGSPALSQSDYERVLVAGIEGKGQRHKMTQFLTRHYYAQGLRGDELANCVTAWFDEMHNGNSEDWINDRGKSTSWIETCAKNWNGYTPSRPIPDPAPWEAWIKKLKLPRPAQRAVLRGMCERAYLYGEVSECGEWIDVDIPKQSLRDFHRQYSVALPALYKWGYVSVVRGYEKPTDKGKGKCRRYRLPIASQNG